MLAMVFPRGLEEAIDVAEARGQRKRMLPAWLTVCFVLGLALFIDRGAARVMRKLAGMVVRAELGGRGGSLGGGASWLISTFG